MSDGYTVSFEDSLRARDYAASTIKVHRLLIRRLAATMESMGVVPARLTVERAAELIRGEERKAREPHKYANIARRFAKHLIELGVASPPASPPRQIAREKLRQGYEGYLHRQRGLSRRTIFHSWRFPDRFLDYRFRHADIDLGAISAGDVSRSS